MKSLSEKQDSTSVSIDTFRHLLLKTDKLIEQQREELTVFKSQLNAINGLIGKTDTVMTYSGSQLELNRRSQEIANKNYRAKEIEDINRLAQESRILNRYLCSEFFFRKGLFKETHNEKCIKDIHALDSLLKMVDIARGNDFLNRVDTLQLKWANVYDCIFNLKIQMKFFCDGVYSEAEVKSGRDKTDSAELFKATWDCWRLAINTVCATENFANAEKSRKGYPVIFRQGNTVTLKSNHKIKYTVVENDMLSGRCLCRPIPNGLPKDVYIPSKLLELVPQ